MIFKKLIGKLYCAIAASKAKHNCEYWVPLSQIWIPNDFRSTRIGCIKYAKKNEFYDKHGYCESKIVLNKDFLLIDGYTSYVIYKNKQGRNTYVPVYFAD